MINIIMIPLMNQSSKINLKNLLCSCFKFTQVSVPSYNFGWLNTVYTTDDCANHSNAVTCLSDDPVRANDELAPPETSATIDGMFSGADIDKISQECSWIFYQKSPIC